VEEEVMIYAKEILAMPDNATNTIFKHAYSEVREELDDLVEIATATGGGDDSISGYTVKAADEQYQEAVHSATLEEMLFIATSCIGWNTTYEEDTGNFFYFTRRKGEQPRYINAKEFEELNGDPLIHTMVRGKGYDYCEFIYSKGGNTLYRGHRFIKNSTDRREALQPGIATGKNTLTCICSAVITAIAKEHDSSAMDIFSAGMDLLNENIAIATKPGEIDG